MSNFASCYADLDLASCEMLDKLAMIAKWIIIGIVIYWLGQQKIGKAHVVLVVSVATPCCVASNFYDNKI